MVIGPTANLALTDLPALIGRILPDVGEFRPGQDEPQHLLDAAER